MSLSLLQANLNHCRQAQDLLLQSVAELEVEVAIVSETFNVPNLSDWFASQDCLAAVYVACRRSSELPLPSRLLERGFGYVAVMVDRTVVVSCYVSLNSGLPAFEHFLDAMTTLVRLHTARAVIVAGDFNAKSQNWGCRNTDARGRVLSDFSAGLNLRVLNRGNTLTCVRQAGDSVVVGGFASASALPLLTEWKVLSDVETLLDHRYVLMRFSGALNATVPCA